MYSMAEKAQVEDVRSDCLFVYCFFFFIIYFLHFYKRATLACWGRGYVNIGMNGANVEHTYIV